MAYYPCPPTAGLTVLEPRASTSFEKPHGVYPAASGPMVLMYGIRNHEYSYGYARDGQIYYAEYFPNALQLLCKGKSARLCLCAPVALMYETRIPDVYETLLEQEARGALTFHRFEALSSGMLDRICRVEADEIRRRDLLHTPGFMAESYRLHDPGSRALAEAEHFRPAAL